MGSAPFTRFVVYVATPFIVVKARYLHHAFLSCSVLWAHIMRFCSWSYYLTCLANLRFSMVNRLFFFPSRFLFSSINFLFLFSLIFLFSHFSIFQYSCLSSLNAKMKCRRNKKYTFLFVISNSITCFSFLFYILYVQLSLNFRFLIFHLFFFHLLSAFILPLNFILFIQCYRFTCVIPSNFY